MEGPTPLVPDPRSDHADDPRPADTPSARLRPGFSVDLPVAADEAVLRLREGLDGPRSHGPSMAAGRQLDFLIEESQTRLWSPRLTVHVEDAPHGCTLRCRFSPRPEIWTGFMFLYSLCVFAVLFGATLGYVQQVSDEMPWGYWVVPGGLLVIGGIHLAGYVGQRLAAGQMKQLRQRFDSLLARQFGGMGPT